jgi:hypothetical protein
MPNAFTKFSAFAIATFFSGIAHAAPSDRSAHFPELPPAKNYLHVAEIATGDFSKKLKLPSGGRAAALDYIFQRMPVREFEDEMLKQSSVLKKGHTKISLRKTPTYRESYEACDWVSQRMALLVVGDALRVYKRKILRPEELTKSLFAANHGREIEASISGIERKLSRSDFLRETHSTYPIQPGDEFYFFRTGFGGGYLIVRHNKIIKDDEGMFEY